MPTLNDNPGQVPAQPETDDDFAPVTEANGPNASASLFELGDRLIAWRKHKDDLDSHKRDANEIIGKLERVIADRMLEEEVPKFTRSGHTLFITTKTYASNRKDCRPALVQWLKDNGHEAIVHAGKPIIAEKVNNRALANVVAQSHGDLIPEDEDFGEETLVYEDVNANVLAAFVKEMMDDEDGIPDDLAELLNISREATVGVRKA